MANTFTAIFEQKDSWWIVSRTTRKVMILPHLSAILLGGDHDGFPR